MDVRDQRHRSARLSGILCALSLLLSPLAAHAADDDGATLSLSASTSGPSEAAADAGPALEKEEADPRPKNPANYEFSVLSVSAYQSWSLAGRWLYFGAGGGLGAPLYRYSKFGSNDADWDPNLEIVHANIFLRVSPVPYVDIDVGPRIALGAALYNVKDPPMQSFAAAGYVDLRVGSEKIKFGPRFEYGQMSYADYKETGWRLTPLMVRVMH